MRSGARLMALSPHKLDAIPPDLAGGVVAVGNFDGLHAGHRVLFDLARNEAARRGVAAVVLTFEPHPRTMFRPESPVFRLTPLPAKARLLQAIGMDGLVVADFSREFSENSADDFIDRILLDRLHVTSVVVGFNFHFGNGRKGTPALLQEAGARKGFAVTVVNEISEADGIPVSSSAIRDDLAGGDIAGANARLGYRWFVMGQVIPGERRGREIGFPTANLRLGPDCQLRHGIYAVRLQRPGGAIIDGVASYGRRPTFDNGAPLLEVFLFDFSDDLYGEEVAVSFVSWIRPELKFDTVASLVEAIGRDVENAKAALAASGRGTTLDRVLAALP